MKCLWTLISHGVQNFPSLGEGPPMLYLYKRSHRGTRMTVIPQLMRKQGRPLPKHTPGGLGDALGRVPGLVDVTSKVFQVLQSRAGGWRGLCAY